MSVLAVWHAVTAYWPLAAVLGVVGLGFVFPAISLPIVRFLFGTERGRWLVAVVIVVAVLLWYREARFSDGYTAAVAHQKAAAESTRADAAEAVTQRDTSNDQATDAARSSANDRQTQHNTRAERVEGIAHAPRPPVPAVCPGPDADLMRELAEGAARVRAAEDRLRGLGRPARGKAP